MTEGFYVEPQESEEVAEISIKGDVAKILPVLLSIQKKCPHIKIQSFEPENLSQPNFPVEFGKFKGFLTIYYTMNGTTQVMFDWAGTATSGDLIIDDLIKFERTFNPEN